MKIMKSMTLAILIIIIIGCSSVSNRINLFTSSIESKPYLIRDILSLNNIYVHDSLKSQISSGDIDLAELSLEIEQFYNNDEKTIITVLNENRSVSLQNF